MPKNAYFLEKMLQNRRSARGIRPRALLTSGGWRLHLQIPALLLPLTDIDLLKARF